MKILSIVGTRPQIFKLDPDLSDVIVNTGQHKDKDMDAIHFKAMKIKPKYNLGCSSDEMGKMIDKLRGVLRKENPDAALVYGDTYSTLAGAIACSVENIKFGHVEAGLRSHDNTMPEEVNRKVADMLATWKFAPSHSAMRNLLEEGLSKGAIHSGDPLFWSFNYFLPLKKRKDFRKFVFATIHRRENLEPHNLKEIIKGLGMIDSPVYFPLHPHTRRIIKKLKIKIPKNIEMVKPQPRKQTLEKIHNSKLVITDSGGIQREAYWMTRLSLCIRPVTEWEEIVESGWSRLVPANAKRIAEEAMRDHKAHGVVELPRNNPYKLIKETLEDSV